MKRLVLYLILIAGLIPIPAAKDHSEQATHSYHTQSGKAKEPEPSPPPVVVQKSVDVNPPEEEGASKKNNSPMEAHDWIDKLNAVSTLIIACFTILLFAGVAVQIRTARNSERAWISVKVRHDVVTSKHASAFLDDWVVYLECIITNCGKTPARLTRFRFRYESAEDKTALAKLPDYGDAGKVMDEMLLAPNDSNPERIHIDSKALHFFDKKAGWLHVYGIVNYLDAFNKKRYTRFCHSCYIPFDEISPDVVPSELVFMRSGPPAYNKAT